MALFLQGVGPSEFITSCCYSWTLRLWHKLTLKLKFSFGVSWTIQVVQDEPCFNLPHLIQVVSCCLFNLATVIINHYNYKNSFNNKNKPNCASILENFMTAVSDAVAKSTLIWKDASQYEINRHTLKRFIDLKASVTKHFYGYDALSDELKMFSDGMENDLAKHVMELSKRFLSKKVIGAIAPLKPTKITLFTMILYNSENSIHEFEAILPSTILSQQCCDVYFISLTIVTQ